MALPGPDFLRVWNLLNLDTFEIIKGQFHAEELTENIGSVWRDTWALNRKHPITQFLHGETNTFSFRGRLFARSFLESTLEVKDQLNQLKEWAERAEAEARPPVLEFWIGDYHAWMASCVIDSLSDIRYERPTAAGSLRHATFTVNLRRYTPYSLEEAPPGDTRYHRARRRDYYELLAYREYKLPSLGDVVRKRHPSQPNLVTGDVVKMPSLEAIRTEKVAPSSISLQTAYQRKESPQRSLRLQMFDARDRVHVSHILVA